MTLVSRRGAVAILCCLPDTVTFAIPVICVASAAGILPGWIDKLCTALLSGGAISLVIWISNCLRAQPAQEHREFLAGLSVEEA
jgi:hypothetical protein